MINRIANSEDTDHNELHQGLPCLSQPFLSENMIETLKHLPHQEGAQWLSGRVLDSRPKGRGF